VAMAMAMAMAMALAGANVTLAAKKPANKGEWGHVNRYEAC